MARRLKPPLLAAAFVSAFVAFALTAAACSGEVATTNAAATTVAAAAPTTTVAPAVTTTTAALPTTTKASAPTTPPELEMTAIDYEFQGVPEIVPAGTRLKLVNASPSEFHSAFIIRLEDGDERTRDEFTELSADDLLPHFGPGRGAMQVVIYARPGESQFKMDLGGPVVRTPGRYVILCLVPVGADPAELERQTNFGPPQQVDGVPRHAQVGMFAEFTVEG